jgi:Protein of unknown function (DUF3185)
MRSATSLGALIAGVVLIYLGYQRQQSLTGKADDAFSKIGHAIDGGGHATTQTIYYVAGGALAVGGLIGLGVLKK